MMSIKDLKNIINNVIDRPVICSNDEIITDNGYVITTKENYEKIKSKNKPRKPLEYDDCENFNIKCTCGKCMDTRFFHGYCTWCGQNLCD